jgi:hypothetical protein
MQKRVFIWLIVCGAMLIAYALSEFQWVSFTSGKIMAAHYINGFASGVATCTAAV